MNNKNQKRRSRLIRDKADGVLVIGIISALLFYFIVGFAIDLSKNAYVKDAQNSQSQQAVEVAVKKIDSKGSITPISVKRMVDEYLIQRGNAITIDKPTVLSDGTTRIEKVEVPDRANNFRGVRGCKTTKDGNNVPYIIVRLSEKREFGNSSSGATVQYTYVNGSFRRNDGLGLPLSDDPASPYNTNVTYKVISAEVYDSSANLMLGSFGIPCQQLTSKVSAVTFGNQSDLL